MKRYRGDIGERVKQIEDPITGVDEELAISSGLGERVETGIHADALWRDCETIDLLLTTP